MLSMPAFGAMLRVTSWNLQDSVGAVNSSAASNAIQTAAAALKTRDPDVILLQGVRDWPMCLDLAQALKPEIYHVLVCSSFRQPRTGAGAMPQTAILSKRKAYFAWSEAWRSPADNPIAGGFVIAAIEAGKRRVSLFSVEVDEQLLKAKAVHPEAADARAEADGLRQWVQGVQFFQTWTNNRPELGAVAGVWLSRSGNSGSGSAETFEPDQKSRLLNEFLAPPLALSNEQKEADQFSAHLMASSKGLPAVLLNQQQTCELDLELVDPATAPITDLPQAKPPLSVIQTSQAVATAVGPTSTVALALAKPVVVAGTLHTRLFWLGLLPGTILTVAVGLLMLGRGKREAPRPVHAALPFDMPNTNNAAAVDTHVVTSRVVTSSGSDRATTASAAQPVLPRDPPASAAGEVEAWQQRALAAEQRADHANDILQGSVMSYLGEWLKAKFVRKLIADRAALLETQQEAALKAIAVDERLTRIEVQLQQQNQAYERRIERLMQELATTKEESRALIRAQIVQIKAEMEAARVRLLAGAEQ
jgi:hypothetical protein